MALDGLSIWTHNSDFRAHDIIIMILHHSIFFLFPVEIDNPEAEGKWPQNNEGMFLISYQLIVFSPLIHIFTVAKYT